jgi:hypothetical protein
MEFYLLWDKHSTSFMLGLSHHRDERRFELFLGVIAIAFLY